LDLKNTIPVSLPAKTGQSDLHGLIREAIAGTRTAQKEIYDRYAPFIYGVIRRYIKDEAEAKEILNDSFFKILTKLGHYEFKGAFEGWMRTTTIYTITDHVRKHARHRQTMQEMPEHLDVRMEQSITSGIHYKDLLLLIHDLPEMHRMVFNLFVFEDYPHKDIAALLSISENNSRWHLNDARKRLKEKIKPFMK
jgi:RNA polymerase sigma-70 factor (ECF subfamily)